MQESMNIVAIIPARMASSRFPGKPMANILGKPMIGHVYEHIAHSPLLTTTAVATCDEEIYDYVISIGGIAVMTADTHKRASDRCAEALLKLEAMQERRYNIVVMVQGDEPMTNEEMIAEALNPMLADPDLQIVNLLGKIKDDKEFEDSNCIKVVCDLQGNALYFSRQPIPTRCQKDVIQMGKQVCIIPFRRDYLLKYTQLAPTPLEMAESIDMLRILEHGEKVLMVPTNFNTLAVDAPSDIPLVTQLMK